MAKKGRSYREEIINGERILVDLKTEKVPLTAGQAKKVAAKSRHLIRISGKKERLSSTETILKEWLKNFAQEKDGFRGVKWLESGYQVLITYKRTKTWIKEKLQELLGKSYDSLVTEQVVYTITLISKTVTVDDINSCLRHLLTKEKGLTDEEFELAVYEELKVIPNMPVLKDLAEKKGINLQDLYVSGETTEVAVKPIAD